MSIITKWLDPPSISDKYIKLELMRMATEAYHTTPIIITDGTNTITKIYNELIKAYNDSVIIDVQEYTHEELLNKVRRKQNDD